jgi:hypothetical protein
MMWALGRIKQACSAESVLNNFDSRAMVCQPKISSLAC